MKQTPATASPAWKCFRGGVCGLFRLATTSLIGNLHFLEIPDLEATCPKRLEYTMIKKARTDHPVQEPIASRWSPYGFTDQPVPKKELCSLFEAARWAASSYNEQPWSYLIAVREDTEEFEKALSCLSEANRAWASNAPVLGFGIASLRFSRNDRPNRVALHDLGLASANLCIEAAARGISIHQMAGILPDRVRDIYRVPEHHEVVTGLVVGYAADVQQLSEPYKQRDLTPRSRKPLDQFVFGGTWGSACRICMS